MSGQNGAQPKRIEDNKFILNSGQKYNVAGFQVEGVSVAGQETCIIFPELKLAFDAGRCPQRSVYQPVILLSHAHMDHIAGLAPHICSRCMLNVSPSIIVMPKSIVATVEKLIAVYRELDGSVMPCQLIGMEPGESYTLPNKLIVRAFPTYHPVPSQGYVVYSTRNKLKAQFQGLRGDEIRDLRKGGVEVSDCVMIPEVAYTGDTSIQWLADESSEVLKDALRAKLLITECSFLDEDTLSQTELYGHQHLFELVKNKDQFVNVENLMLNHFSARYKVQDIQAILEEHWPLELKDRTYLFLSGLC